MFFIVCDEKIFSLMNDLIRSSFLFIDIYCKEMNTTEMKYLLLFLIISLDFFCQIFRHDETFSNNEKLFIWSFFLNLFSMKRKQLNWSNKSDFRTISSTLSFTLTINRPENSFSCYWKKRDNYEWFEKEVHLQLVCRYRTMAIHQQ